MPHFVNDDTARLERRVVSNPIKREIFDPNNQEHRQSLLTFLTTGNWGSVHFYAEHPYTTVPETVMRKLCLTSLNQ